MLQKTNLAHSVQRLARLFHSVPDFKEKQLETDVSPELALPVDAQDLEEILGNILENAFQWSQSKVRLSARSSGEISTIFVEDDGPGIAVADRSEALRSGGRLDTSAPGTGLGLAIAGDLMEAYGGKIELHSSIEYGGLCVVLKIPHEDESVRPSVYL